MGHIESVSKSGLLGKSGRLVLQFDNVETASGAKDPIEGWTKGQRRKGWSTYRGIPPHGLAQTQVCLLVQ